MCVQKRSDMAEDSLVSDREGYIAAVFNSVLGHDLRNPLSVVTMGAQMLKSASAADAQERTLRIAGRIENGASRLGILINELLQFSRLTLAQPPDLSLSEFDLADLATKVGNDLKQPTIPDGYEIHSQGDLKGTWDRERMARILTSLVTQVKNSIPAGFKTQVDLLSVNDETVSIEVRNIAVANSDVSEVAPDVVWLEILTVHQGLDISVYVANETIRGCGGTLFFHSAPNSGTRFRVLLPRNIKPQTLPVSNV